MKILVYAVLLLFRPCLSDDKNKACKELEVKKSEKNNLKTGDFLLLGWHEKEKVKIGETARFTCNHIGYREGNPAFSPEVELHWFQGNKELRPNNKISIDGCNKKPFILGTRITISNITNEDEGRYYCKLWRKGRYGLDLPVLTENLTIEIKRPETTWTDIHTTPNGKEYENKALKWLPFLTVPIVGFLAICACCCACKYDDVKKDGSTCVSFICKKLIRKKENISSNDMSVYFSAHSQENRSLVDARSGMSDTDKENKCKKYITLYPFLSSSDVKEIWKYEIQRGRLQCEMQHSMPIVLGTGNFGQVYAGTVLNPKGDITPVAVKKLNDGYSASELGNFLREVVTLMRAGNHINVISLVATIVLDTLEESDKNVKVQRPPILVMELATGGNLRKYLQDNRDNFAYAPLLQSDWCIEDKNTNMLDMKKLISFGYQAARGMEHLSTRKILHRDLAARNVLLTDQLMIKIADFGLSKFMTDEKQYYRVNHQGITPAKWTAPESLWTSKFTVKSDVWSYGVLLWEILTLGNQPYTTIPACKLYEYLTTGNRLKRPNLASFELHEIMLMCWAWDPELRPDFNTLVKKMSEILLTTSKQPYQSFSTSRVRLTGCSTERDSGLSCGTGSITESSFDSTCETSYSSTSYCSYTSTETVIAMEDDAPRERSSTIVYEIMNPLYEHNSSETEKGAVAYVNDISRQMKEFEKSP